MLVLNAKMAVVTLRAINFGYSMSIGQDIKQHRQFRNEHHKATVNLLFSASWLMENLKKFLQSEDITPQQYNILRILRGNGQPLSTLPL